MPSKFSVSGCRLKECILWCTELMTLLAIHVFIVVSDVDSSIINSIINVVRAMRH